MNVDTGERVDDEAGVETRGGVERLLDAVAERGAEHTVAREAVHTRAIVQRLAHVGLGKGGACAQLDGESDREASG